MELAQNRRHRRGLAVCVAGGALCAWLGTPLPWMIGPLAGMAIFQFAGASLRSPPFGREAGQLIIGLALGLYFTPEVGRRGPQARPGALLGRPLASS